MSRFAAQLQVRTREATLRRLCRVSAGWRYGEPVQVFEVREPTPENLAAVSTLLRRAYRTCQHASGTVFLARC